MSVSVVKIFSPVSDFLKTAFPCSVLLLVFSLSSCEAREIVELQVGSEYFSVEVADTPEERAKGLMNREGLGENEGMLFVFPHDQKVSFWMKNTSIPLSVAYISADGIIREIHDLIPFREIPVTSKYSVRFALELSRGAFERAASGPGEKILGLPLD
jgi:uncharacterized membrane protein (UPF0127 family)